MVENKRSAEIQNDILELILNKGEMKLLILVSGGSQIEMLHQLAGELVKRAEDLQGVTIRLLDERYDPEQPGNQNYPQIADNEDFKILMQDRGLVFPRTFDTGEALATAAERNNRLLKEALDDPQTICLALIGIGPDDHIAGILPHREDAGGIFYDQYVVGYEVDDISESDNPYRKRITATFKAIEEMDKVWVFAPGERKLEQVALLRRAIGNGDVPSREEISSHPSLFLATISNVRIYSDV